MSTEFLRNLTSGNLTGLAQQAARLPQTITGQSVSPQVAQSVSFQQALSTFQNILGGGELPETFRQSVTTSNLIGLGEAQQRAKIDRDEQRILNEQRQVQSSEATAIERKRLTDINESLSTRITELGQSLQGGAGGFDPFKFLTDNPLLGGIGIGGLAAGAVILLLVLRR